LRDGSWGFCLKEITPKNAIDKEKARIGITAKQALGVGDPSDLEIEIAQCDAVTLPFAPHKWPESSRLHEVDPVRPVQAETKCGADMWGSS